MAAAPDGLPPQSSQIHRGCVPIRSPYRNAWMLVEGACRNLRLPASRSRLSGRDFLGASNDRLEHRRREPARERVLLARVVRAEERVAGQRTPPHRARTAVAVGPGGRAPPAPEARRPTRMRRAPPDPHLGQQRRARGPGTARTCRAPRSSACWPAARSGPPPRCTRRTASVRRRRTARAAGRKTRRVERPKQEVPRGIAVKTRPVRLPPCAAGASPTSRIRASGSPNPGTGRPQYVSSRNRATFSRATRSRHSTNRGQRWHSTISAVSAASAARSVIGPTPRPT